MYKRIIIMAILIFLANGVSLNYQSSCSANGIAFQLANQLRFKEKSNETIIIESTNDNKIIVPQQTEKIITENKNESRLANIYYDVIYNHIINTTPNLGNNKASWTTDTILYYCSKYNVDPLLVTALFTQESGFSMEAHSPTGAIGIAQLQPETAELLGVNPSNAEENIEGGIRYLSQQLESFRDTGDMDSTLAIAAYNAGPGAINKYGGNVPPYKETVNHVNSISAIFTRLDAAINSRV